MTGMDNVLNKRIASLFLNEFELFRNILAALPNHINADIIKFNIHKIRPSLIIFELDALLEKYESLANRKKEGELLSEEDKAFIEITQETDSKINLIREFTQSI